jgi:hypothetical protein
VKKQVLFLIVILLGFHLLAQNASGQNSGTNQTQDAQLLLERCAQAMGSPKAGLEVIAEGQTQNANSDSVSSVLIKTRGLEQFRLELGSAEQAEVFIVNKGRGWHQMQGRTLPMSRHTTAYFKADHLPALICGAGRLPQGMRFTYAGTEVVASRPVFHIKLDAIPQRKNEQADAIESLISEYHVFIDQDSFIVLKTSRYVFSPDAVENHSLWETLYSDYRAVDGAMMPFRIDNLVSGHQFSTTVFSKITTGVSLSDQEFQEAK